MPNREGLCFDESRSSPVTSLAANRTGCSNPFRTSPKAGRSDRLTERKLNSLWHLRRRRSKPGASRRWADPTGRPNGGTYNLQIKYLSKTSTGFPRINRYSAHLGERPCYPAATPFSKNSVGFPGTAKSIAWGARWGAKPFLAWRGSNRWLRGRGHSQRRRRSSRQPAAVGLGRAWVPRRPAGRTEQRFAVLPVGRRRLGWARYARLRSAA